MTPQARAIARVMTVTAGIVALLLVIGLPVVYFTISYEYMRGSLEARAEVDARHVEKLVLANPNMWMYEQVRLAELLERRSAKGIPEARRILAMGGQLVAESADPLPRPIVARRHTIYDAGLPVAEIEVAHSLRPLVFQTAVAFAAALLVAALVFAVLRILPLRAVAHAYRSLEESENRYRQAQKMEAVGRLAGGVAHDFNNMLTVILSFASELAETLTGEQRELAQEIQRAGQRASALTRQLLSFSRKQVVHPEVLRVAEIVPGLASMMSRLVGQGIEIELAMADGVGCIHMDPALLEQALVNLVVNARDAMPEGGKLTIEARNAEVGPARHGPAGVAPGRYVVIRVSDTGTGMDDATRSRIFEPFFTTKPKGKGTGLGLAMVFGTVEQSGGYIDVASELGAGTTFTIHLPRVPAPAASQGEAPRPEGGRAGGGKRILVVDDEPQVRASVRLFLAAGGFSVLEAGNGDEGLARFRADEDGSDLVLTDLVMPGMGGVALGRAIRARRPSVPILYMSGYSDEVFSGKEELPAGHFLQKPFDRETLLDRVHAALAALAAAARSATPTSEETSSVAGKEKQRTQKKK